MNLTITDHGEVILRVCISLIIAYILTLGNFDFIPESQVIVIISATSIIVMVMPTLLFSIGAAIFPAMVVITCMALVVSTILLAIAATAGRNAYVVAYFFFALILSGLRFTKEQTSSALLLMLTSLNTMGLVELAEEGGLSFVASLWTEKGTTNENAVFRNSIIGMCWVAVCLVVPRLLPPWRTARSVLSRKLLPKVLTDVAAFIRLNMELIANSIEGDADEDVDGDGIGDCGKETKQKIEDATAGLVKDASLTISGSLSNLTRFEPRLIRSCFFCSAPVDIVTMLTELTNAVNRTLTLALSLRAFSKVGSDDHETLSAGYLELADTLEGCAKSLATLTPMEKSTPLLNETDTEEDRPPPPYHLVRLGARTKVLEEHASEWIKAMGPVDRSRSSLDMTAMKLEANAVTPWVMAGGIGLLAAIFQVILGLFSPILWKRIVRPPYYDLPQAVWCLKFAVGFTALVCMTVYWPWWQSLEVQTSDPIESAHFAGWSLIAYAFGTTFTVEGTWKKSTMRILGTILGGFSGWLALTACQGNSWGLGAWMLITSTAAAFFGIPKGLKSRFGVEPEFTWLTYFCLTQALVVMEVYQGYGGKNDIFVNRVVSNIVGVLIAMLMAVIPPGVWGGSPREIKFLLEDIKLIFQKCIELMLDKSLSADDLKAELRHLGATTKRTIYSSLHEANGNFKDADQLEKLFCILKMDPHMHIELNHMAVLGSSILGLVKYAIAVADHEPDAERRFGSENEDVSKDVCTLKDILEGLEVADFPASTFHVHHRKGKGKVHTAPNEIYSEFHRVPPQKTYVHLCVYIYHYVVHCEETMDEVSWGFLGQKKMRTDNRSKLPENFPAWGSLPLEEF